MRKEKAGSCPSLDEESALQAQGHNRVAGLDEAGRGALAGPVVAAAVILPANPEYRWLPRVRDSKLLAGKERSAVLLCMRESGVEIGLGIVEPSVIDSVNILNATRKAMKLALADLDSMPDCLLIDALTLPGLRMRQKGIIRGDRTVTSIACASIAAKVTRDDIMLELDARYPHYGFASHKGYGTAVHMESLRRHGACPVHRLTFAPVRSLARII
jgi:ribonuclease HII